MRTISNYGKRTAQSKVKNIKSKYYLFFEGVNTEPQYFEGIREYSQKLELNTLIEIIPVRRSRTNSGRCNISTIISDIENKKQIKDNEDRLILTDVDYICIIFDRDNLPEEQIIRAIKYSKENKNHLLFFTNPCFEFWLLLHTEDVYKLGINEQRNIFNNATVTQTYKYIGSLLKVKKMIKRKKINFNNYIDFINQAVENEKPFNKEINLMLKCLGSNIGSLILQLRSK